MNNGDRRCSFEEVQEMERLHNLGLPAAEIGRKIKRHHSTILEWLKRKFNTEGLEHKFLRGGRRQKQTKAELEALKREQIINSGQCVICKRPREEQWRLTTFCSAKCWQEDWLRKNPRLNPTAWNGMINIKIES